MVKKCTKKVSEDKVDMVNHPPHYQFKKGYEIIDLIEDLAEWLELKDKEAYLYTQMIGYLLRYKKKNGKEDLEKAKFFLNRMIEKYEEFK